MMAGQQQGGQKGQEGRTPLQVDGPEGALCTRGMHTHCGCLGFRTQRNS